MIGTASLTELFASAVQPPAAVFVMGLSMGGALALRLAEQRGEVAGIVLVNPYVVNVRRSFKLLPVLKPWRLRSRASPVTSRSRA